MWKFLSPPAPKPRIAPQQIDRTYKAMRLKVFLGAFVGYAAYYLVRKNLSLAAPDMISAGLLDKASVGIAGSAISIAYAFSKFIMGSISDRSDARKFLVVGLILSALLMVGVGFIPFRATAFTQNMALIFLFMLLIGWLSGMGWPPCGRIMAGWFSQ
ncbi:MAG: MFS transporter, partial [Prevotellaceae bacterium]|nr:MFS transporter [Prevotellaceae bacterium]